MTKRKVCSLARAEKSGQSSLVKAKKSTKSSLVRAEKLTLEEMQPPTRGKGRKIENVEPIPSTTTFSNNKSRSGRTAKLSAKAQETRDLAHQKHLSPTERSSEIEKQKALSPVERSSEIEMQKRLSLTEQSSEIEMQKPLSPT